MTLWQYILCFFKIKTPFDIIKENFEQHEKDKKLIRDIIEQDINFQYYRQEKLQQKLLSMLLFLVGIGLFIYNNSKEIGLFIAGTGLYGFIPENKSDDKRTIVSENKPEDEKTVVKKIFIVEYKSEDEKAVVPENKPEDKPKDEKTVAPENKPNDEKTVVKETFITVSPDSRRVRWIIFFIFLFIAMLAGIYYLCKQQFIQILCVLSGMFLMCFLNIFKRYY